MVRAYFGSHLVVAGAKDGIQNCGKEFALGISNRRYYNFRAHVNNPRGSRCCSLCYKPFTAMKEEAL